MTENALVVLAAGIGTRYGGEKQTEAIGPSGQTLLDYSVYDAIQVGFDKIVFVIRNDMEAMFRKRVEDTVAHHCEVAYVTQELDALPDEFHVPSGRTKPWGTAHATLICQQAISGPFAVINADDFYGRSAYRLLRSFLQNVDESASPHQCCLVSYMLANSLTDHGHVSRGVCDVSNDGFLIDINERKQVQRFADGIKYCEDDATWTSISDQTPVSMNMWGFPESILSDLSDRFAQFLGQEDPASDIEYLLPEVVGDLVAENLATVKVLPTDEHWFGVTYQRDTPVVKKKIKHLVDSGEYPYDLWAT